MNVIEILPHLKAIMAPAKWAPPHPTPYGTTIGAGDWWILAGIAAVVAVAIVLMIVFKKKKTNDKEKDT